MIKGRYVGTITVNFCVDENNQNLLPLETLKKSVEEDFSGVIKSLLEDEVSDIATVEVIQQYADLHKE